LIILIPPQVQPWNTGENHIARVYNLKNGSFLQDVKDIKFHNDHRLSRLCIDPLNNLIWGITIANDLVIQSFTNHGPGACFYEVAEPNELENEKSKEKVLDEDTNNEIDKKEISSEKKRKRNGK